MACSNCLLICLFRIGYLGVVSASDVCTDPSEACYPAMGASFIQTGAQSEVKVEALADSVVEERKRARKKLVIEADLSSSLKVRAWRSDEDCETNAANTFDQALHEADLDKELTDSEKEHFKTRFINEMLANCKYDVEIAAHWIEKAAEAVEHQKPVTTEAIVKSINSANIGYTVSNSWMPDLTSSQFDDLMGLEIPASEEESATNDTSPFRQICPCAGTCNSRPSC